MKSTKHFAFIGMVITLIITSCSMQKRVYMSGYHLEWKKYKHTNNEENFGINKNTKQFIQNENELVESIIESDASSINEIESFNLLENVSASTEINPIIYTSSEKKSFKTNNQTFKPASVIENKIVNSNKNSSKVKFNRNLSKKIGEGMSTSSMLTLGWVFTSIAILSLFIFWPLIFFLIPGLYFLIVGYKKKNGNSNGSKKNNTYGEFQDVVYLKNGSIIRGIIIEQIPNVSLKIQTADSSIFVYKMEEIEKMTKEESK